MKTIEINVALCKGEHEITAATNGSFYFNEIIDTTNVKEIEEEAEKIARIITPISKFKLHINLYNTGPTVALIAAIKACKKRGFIITLYHFNEDRGDYYPQDI